MDNNNFQNNNMQGMQNGYGQPQQNLQQNPQYNMGNQTAQQQQFNNRQGINGLNGYQNNQNLYQTSTLENPYYNPNNIQHPRRTGFKWVVIGGLVLTVVIFIALICLVVGWLFPSYNIDDYDLVEEQAEEVLDMEMEEIEKEYLEDAQSEYGKSLENLCMGMVYDDVSSIVMWLEYEEKDDAKDQYEDLVDDLEDEYDDLEDTKSNGWSTNGKITEMWYEIAEDEDEDIEESKTRNAVILKDNYILIISIDGDDPEEVDELYKDFLKSLK